MTNKNSRATTLDLSLYSTHRKVELTCLQISNSITRNDFVALVMVLFNLAKHKSIILPEEPLTFSTDGNDMDVLDEHLHNAIYTLLEGGYITPNDSYQFSEDSSPSSITCTKLLSDLFIDNNWFDDNGKFNERYQVINHKHRFLPALDFSTSLHNATITNLLDDFKVNLGITHKQYRKALRVILLNLVKEETLLISRAKEPFKESRYNKSGIGRTAFTKVIDRLVDAGYIYQLIGNTYGKNRFKTTVIKRNKLSSLFKNYNWLLESEDNPEQLTINPLVLAPSTPELIVLKERISEQSKAKRLVEYKDTSRTVAFRRDMTAYNELLNNSKITDSEGNDIHKGIAAFRTFRYYKNHKFDHGGRIYGVWCKMPSIEREGIKINGLPTTEVDIQASHINISYLKETGRFYTDGDPYKLTVNGQLIPRGFVKQISNILFFSPHVKSAVTSIGKFYTDSKYKERLTIYNEAKVIARPTDIINAYLKKHHTIKNWLMEGKQVGMTVQHMESELIMEVINELTELDEPVLTVYDSIICTLKNEKRIREILKSPKKRQSST